MDSENIKTSSLRSPRSEILSSKLWMSPALEVLTPNVEFKVLKKQKFLK